MNTYQATDIRNVAIFGHLGSGKTSFVESLLFVTKAIDKKGEVEKKNTVSDYYAEEQARQTSLVTSLCPVEYKGVKINFLDTPGSEEMIGEMINVLSVAGAAILVVDATKGVEVGTERCWQELRARNIPTIVFINKMDKENIKYDQVVSDIQAKLSSAVTPIVYPDGVSETFKGLHMVIDNADASVAALYEPLCEAVAQSSEELMEKYFSGEPLTLEEVNKGLHMAAVNGECFPLTCGSSIKDIGIVELLDMVLALLPSPFEKQARKAHILETNTEAVLKADSQASLGAYVFKTIVDPFVGTISLFKIYQGRVQVGQDVYIPNIDTVVKLPQIFTMRGKTQINIDSAEAGDIIAVSKLSELQIGYTLTDKKGAVEFIKDEYPTSIFFYAINPKNKQDEDKLSPALQKLAQEDPSFEYHRNPETAQLLVGGQGVLHLGFILDRLKNTFKVDVETADPKIVYRETIKGRTTGEKGVQGRHKKQNGGGGQFGDVWIKFQPTDKDFEFSEEIVGGSVPKNYFPAVEKGLQQCMEKGPLAGFPVVGVKATLVDGSYHPVDSNEISFVMAAHLAWQAAIAEVKPTILEPIMEMKITVKGEHVGSIMSDMSKRRGRILGQEDIGNGLTVVTAEAPEAEIIKYATDLKTMTQASGYFSRSFLRYDAAPEEKIKKIIEEYKQA